MTSARPPADPPLERKLPAPPADMRLMWLAGVCVALPVIALMWVGSYAREEPKLFDFPFFIWYQFLWVILCSLLTYAAYRLVLKARPHRPMNADGTGFLDEDDDAERTDGEARA